MDKNDNNPKRKFFSGNYRFNGMKLKLAREYRCMTISELSQKIEISHQMISSYEKGDKIPTEERIKKIIESLEFPRTFFFTPNYIDGNKNSPNFFSQRCSSCKKISDTGRS